MKRRKLWTVIIAFCMLFTLLPVEAADITDVLPAGGGAYSMALAYPVKKAAAHGDLPDTSEMETVNGGDTAQSVSLLANGEYADWEAAGEAAVEGTDYAMSDDNVFTVYTALGLAKVANYVNSGETSFIGWTVRLANDIDLAAAGVIGYDKDTVNETNSWNPIGTFEYDFSSGNVTIWPFQGVFDGGGHKVQNLYMNVSFGNTGLFGSVFTDMTVGGEQVVIRDVHIEGANITGGFMANSFLAGFLSEAIITGCSIDETSVMTITGDSVQMNGAFVGGAQTSGLNLGGEIYIENCTNNGTISGGMLTGGIAGATGQRISDCTNNGSVSANIDAGGIVGYYQEAGGIAPFEILDCVNNGDVSTTNGWAGGIAGEVVVSSASSLIANCYNTGTVTGGSEVGGIAGGIDNGQVANCYNIGAVSGREADTSDLGGIAGYLTNGSVLNCYHTGVITNGALDSTGGLVGRNSSIVQFCYASAAPLFGAAASGTAEHNAQILNGNINGTPLYQQLNQNIAHFITAGITEDQAWWQNGALRWQTGEDQEYARFLTAWVEWGTDGVTYGNSGTFAELRAAVSSSTDTLYARMTGDMRLDTYLAAMPNKTLIFDLAGHTLTASSTYDKFLVVNDGATLQLEDSSAEKSGKVTGHQSYSAVEVMGGGTFMMNGGTITGNHGGNKAGGVTLMRNGAFIMNGGTITGNTSNNIQAGIYAANGSMVTISGDAVITGNTGLDGDCDLWLDTLNGNTLTIGDSGLGEAADIGIYINSRNFEFGQAFTAPYADTKASVDNFTNNSGNFEVKEIDTEDGQKQMILSRIQSMTLAASPEDTAVYGADVTLTATLIGANSSSGKTVKFYNNTGTEPVLLGSATTAGGVATLTLKALDAANYNLQAVFAGSASHEIVQSNTIAYTVTQATPTVTLNTENPQGIGENRSVDLAAAVTGVTGGEVPTGTVEFFNGETSLGTAQIADGKAVFTWNGVPVGTHALRAVYSGSTNYNTAEGAASYNLDKDTQDELAVGGVPENIVYGGEPFTLTVTGGSGTGALAYAVTSGDSVSVDAATGEVTILKAGESTITVTKAADDNYNEVSAAVTITVAQAIPTITASPEASRVRRGQLLSTSELTGGVVTGLNGVELEGTWVWENDREMEETGNFTETAVFTPTDTNYAPVKASDISVNVYTSSGGGNATPRYMVSFDTQGGSQINSRMANKNTAVREPEEPKKEGYTFGGWYTDKACTEAYDFETKVTQNITLYAKWIGEGEEPDEPVDPVQPDEWENPFMDVKENDWFYGAVKYSQENGLFSGITANTFAPNTAITRGMLVTVLWRNENKPVVNYLMTFSDVEPQAYYAEAVRWAASEGIVKGYSQTEFAPDRLISREEMAAIMNRYADYKDMDVNVRGDLTKFADQAQIADWARSNVAWAVGYGLMSGRDNNVLDPQGSTTRAETAAILQRFLEK